jgi:hypothetical protein
MNDVAAAERRLHRPEGQDAGNPWADETEGARGGTMGFPALIPVPDENAHGAKLPLRHAPGRSGCSRVDLPPCRSRLQRRRRGVGASDRRRTGACRGQRRRTARCRKASGAGRGGLLAGDRAGAGAFGDGDDTLPGRRSPPRGRPRRRRTRLPREGRRAIPSGRTPRRPRDYGHRHRGVRTTTPFPLRQMEIEGVEELDGRVRRVDLHVGGRVEQRFGVVEDDLDAGVDERVARFLGR